MNKWIWLLLLCLLIFQGTVVESYQEEQFLFIYQDSSQTVPLLALRFLARPEEWVIVPDWAPSPSLVSRNQTVVAVRV